jgi:hypothetical protein
MRTLHYALWYYYVLAMRSLAQLLALRVSLAAHGQRVGEECQLV